MKRNYLYIILLIVCVGFIFNLHAIFSQSIRLDESQSIWVAAKSISAILKTDAQDVHVPLYTIVLHFWIQLFGDNIVVVRFLSLLFYLLTLPFLYLVAKDSSSKSTAVLTLLLFGLSPFISWYSGEARMYTLFTLTVSANHLFFLRMLRSEGNQGKLGYLLSSLFGVFTHYFFLFLLMSQFIYVTITTVFQRFRYIREQKTAFIFNTIRRNNFLSKYILLLGGLFFIFVPWLFYVITLGSASNTQPLLPRPTSFNFLQLFVNFIFGFQNQKLQSILISLWPLSAASLFLIFTKRYHVNIRNTYYFLAVTFLPIIIVFFVSFVKPIFLSRYLILTSPTLFFILALIVRKLSSRLAPFTAVLLAIFMISTSIYQNNSHTTPVREDYKAVTADLNKKVSPQDIVVTSVPFIIYPIEYYYDGLARIETMPKWNRYREGAMPAFSDKTMKTQINEYKKSYIYLYLVLSYDQGYEQNIRKYLDSNYALIGKKEYASSIELRVYKLRYL